MRGDRKKKSLPTNGEVVEEPDEKSRMLLDSPFFGRGKEDEGFD